MRPFHARARLFANRRAERARVVCKELRALITTTTTHILWNTRCNARCAWMLLVYMRTPSELRERCETTQTYNNNNNNNNNNNLLLLLGFTIQNREKI